MNLDDILLGRRIRQNHALEHATFTILAQQNPHFTGSARSFSDGFIVFGNVDLGELRRASEEALRRLQAGEAELAIHPNCGTNLAVGISMVTIGTLLGMASNHQRTRVLTAAASSLAGWAAARPVGEYVQKHFTTLPDLAGVRITDISRRTVLGIPFTQVRTVQE
ncbi:MAG TPA: DUF6391 domain-containing protein [Ktedonobacteraceae bacterium]|jgi:hypothetical protein|nr:DUF6391 domain-containing protein [Ktedonobacteraceae bacterium]